MLGDDPLLYKMVYGSLALLAFELAQQRLQRMGLSQRIFEGWQLIYGIIDASLLVFDGTMRRTTRRSPKLKVLVSVDVQRCTSS